METNNLFEFDRFRLDAIRRLLFSQGQPIPLTSKAFDTLLVLVRNRDRVVEKQELLKTIWPDSFVEESNLAQHISALRKALGDQPGENRFIATVPGRGYRFVGEVTVPAEPRTQVIERRTTTEMVIEEEVEMDTAAAPPPAKPRHPLRMALLVILPVALLAGGRWYWVHRSAPADAAPPRSLAVLPFQQLSATPDDEYLGLGLTDAVITRLSNIRQLVVRPTSSVLKYTQHPNDLTIPGRELAVDAVLDGKVQKYGDDIRVSVQLIRTSDNRALWADNFDTPSGGIFNVEDAVSAHVAQALAIRLGAPEKHGNTVNAEAYRDYMQGRYASFHFTSQGLQQAVDYFNRAIALDPSYALAYSGLADTYTTASEWVLSPHEALGKAETAARKALAADDSLAEAHASLGHALMHQWKLADAEKEFHRALELGPNQTFSNFFYAEYLCARRRYDDSVAEMNKAIQLDPGSAELRAFLAWPLALKRDYNGALRVSNDAIRIEPDYWVAHMTAGLSLLGLHQFSEAIAEFEKTRTMNPASTLNLAGLAQAWAASGKRSQAAEMLNTFRTMSRTQYVSPMDVAAIHVALGETDLAFQWLDKAFDDQSEMLLFLKDYPPFAPLRSDARFAALLHRVGVGE